PRAQTHLARAMDAVPTVDFSDPAAWQGWIDLLSARAGPDAAYWETALNVDVPEMDFGTVSSALIALPRAELELGRHDGVPAAAGEGSVVAQAAPVFLYADGPGDRAPYQAVLD
ncbi:MAG: hypothetical protein VX152_09230, partial [Pseudomonadota bacterium]|nr:hypothetical protein [Pseudomonadota bacterium]